MLPQPAPTRQAPRPQPRHFRRCQHCGHISQDVTEQTDYVGGRGYTTSHKCRNARECWARWDRQNGLVR